MTAGGQPDPEKRSELKKHSEIAEKVLFNLLEYLKESSQKELAEHILLRHQAPCEEHGEETCPVCTLKTLVTQIGRRLRNRQALCHRIQNTLLRIHGGKLEKVLLGSQSHSADFLALTLDNVQALLSYLTAVDMIGTGILELKGKELEEFRVEMLTPALGEAPESLTIDPHAVEDSNVVFLDFVRRFSTLGVAGLTDMGDPDRFLEALLKWTSEHADKAEEIESHIRNGRLVVPLAELRFESN